MALKAHFPAWILVSLTLLCGGCLLYTHTINMAPTISIVLPQSFARNAPLTFSADAHDENLATLTYRWGVTRDTCPDNYAIPTSPPIVFGDGAQITFTPGESGAFCVFVTVTDDSGATDHTTRSFTIEDPKLQVQVTRTATSTSARAVAGVALLSRLHYTATTSGGADGAPLTVAWTLMSPSGMQTPPPCPLAPNDACFTVDTQGPWTIGVTATAGTQTATDMDSFTVAPDSAPCILETNPPWGEGIPKAPSDPITFAVTQVADDVDPLPALPDRASKLSFSWSWRMHGDAAFTRVVVPDLPNFSFSGGTFQYLQTVDVRVEAIDSRGVAAQPELRACETNDIDATECFARTGCPQWVTWTVNFQ